MELLVVISIIALLIAILLPTLGSAMESAKNAQCQSNLRQLAQAQFAYVGDYGRHAPLWINGSGNANAEILDYVDANFDDTTDTTSILNCTNVSKAELDENNLNPTIGIASYGLNPGIFSPKWDYDPQKVPSPSRYILIAEQPIEQNDLAVTADGMTRFIVDPDNPSVPWRYYATHKPERGFRHNADGSNAAMNDGHVAFLSPQELTISNTELPPLFLSGPNSVIDSRWIWWPYEEDGVSKVNGCTCGP